LYSGLNVFDIGAFYNLVEDGSVGAEERVLSQTSLAIGGTDVEDLALGIGVSVVTSINLTCARESGFGDFGVDGIVLGSISSTCF